MAKKRNWQRKKKFKGGGGGGGGGGTALMSTPSHEVRIDYEALPADLSLEELEELVASLPPSTRKTKPKATSYDDLVALQLADLHEVAKKEKVENGAELRKRRDLIWAIAFQRLQKHVPVKCSGLLEVGSDGHAFLRYARNSYLPHETDPFVPPSMIQRYAMRTGMTVEGELRPPKEGEKYFALKSISTIDAGDPEAVMERTPFKELVPLYPDQRLILERVVLRPLEDQPLVGIQRNELLERSA
ncbi:MAG: hypothetical protein AAF564_02275, partial [Bacteroidota bacterium]